MTSETRPRLRRMMLWSLAGAGGLGAYAFLIEPRWLETTHTRVPIAELPAPLEGLRIALLSDFHTGGGTPLSLLERACRRVMAASPDLIALTGDFAARHDALLERTLEILEGLKAPLGVFAVPGNHEHEKGFAAWKEALSAHPGITDLTNRALVREARGCRIGIAGIDDLTTGYPWEAVIEEDRGADLQILLSHNPDFAERLCCEGDGVDLVLSGHTHGGQVRLPFYGAVLNPSRRSDLYEAGLQKRPWAQVYVSRGIGTVHLPLRFLCRPEVAILELSPES